MPYNIYILTFAQLRETIVRLEKPSKFYSTDCLYMRTLLMALGRLCNKKSAAINSISITFIRIFVEIWH